MTHWLTNCFAAQAKRDRSPRPPLDAVRVCPEPHDEGAVKLHGQGKPEIIRRSGLVSGMRTQVGVYF